jgi:hypothetical protein
MANIELDYMEAGGHIVIPDIDDYNRLYDRIDYSGGDVKAVFDDCIEFVSSVISCDMYTKKFVVSMWEEVMYMAEVVPREDREIAKSIFSRKNTERRSGWMDVGARGAFIELLAKIQRIGSCYQFEETVSDAVRDMFNYCIITMMCIQSGNIVGNHRRCSIKLHNLNAFPFVDAVADTMKLNGIAMEWDGFPTYVVLQTDTREKHIYANGGNNSVTIYVPDHVAKECSDEDAAFATRLIMAYAMRWQRR